MNRFLSRAMAATAGSFALMQAASAQVLWDNLCHDTITDPTSNPYVVYDLPIGSSFHGGQPDALFGVTLGLTGTNTYSRDCWGLTANQTINVAGGVGFQSGPIGSVQTEADDYLSFNFGMPYAVGSNIGYATVVTQAATGAITKTRWGGIDTAFYTASDRAIVLIGTVGGLRTTLRVDQVGDAARFSWTLANNSASAVSGGLWFGQWVSFLDQAGFKKPAGYVYAPGLRPIRKPTRFRTDGSGDFDMPQYLTISPSRGDIDPSRLQFSGGAYGLRLENKPTEGADSPFPDLTPVDELRVGENSLANANTGLLGFPWQQSTFPEVTLDDAIFTDYEDYLVINPLLRSGPPSDTAFLQKWQPTTIPSGGSREIVAYYRGTWGNSNFTRPYAVVVDAPRVLSIDPANPTQYLNNPATFRVYLDNIRGYTTLDQEIPLEDVRITVTFPDGKAGLDNGDGTVGATTITRFISRIAPKRVGSVDIPIRVSDDANGDVPYRVSITTRTNANRVVTGFIKASAQPRLPLKAGANLVGTPYNYANGSWESILGLTVDQQFRAFTWDPQQGEYVIQTGPERGVGTWILSDAELGVRPLAGSPSAPTDLGSGAPLITLKSGWNLIANPYPYPVPIGQLVGVSASTPDTTQTYQQLVNSGVLSGAVAYYDTSLPTPQYVYLSGFEEPIQPNRGYWVFVNTDSDLTLSFPPVFEPFVPGKFSSAIYINERGEGEVAANRVRWSMQVAARTADRVDAQNRIGVASSAASARNLSAVHAPLTPEKKAVAVSILGNLGNKKRNLARAFVTGSGTQTFDLQVLSRQGGPVTVSFPDIAAVPANVKLTLVDAVSRRRVDLRSNPSYAVTTEPRIARNLKIVAETTVAQAIIRSLAATVVNTGVGRAARADYDLGQSGRVTVRVLRNGALVATPRNGATQTGRASTTWNFRDAAGRPVPAGTYTIEVTAVTPSGARQTATVDVIR